MCRAWLTFLVLAAVIVPHAAGAEAPAATADEAPAAERIPRLGGHLFVPNTLVPQPFVRTAVRNALGLGQALDVEAPVAVLDSTVVFGVEGDIAVAALDFSYQQAIKRWLGFHVSVSIVGRLGTEVQSLLATGVTTAFAFRFGWLVPVWADSNDHLSVSFDVSNRSFALVDMHAWAEGILTGAPVPLVRQSPSLRAMTGLRYARGFNDLIGLTAMANLGYGESVERDQGDEWFVDTGFSLGFDLGTRTAAPIYLALGYVFDSFPESFGREDRGTHASLFQIAYSGRPDFSIGLEARGNSFPVSWKNSNLETLTTMVVMQYYF